MTSEVKQSTDPNSDVSYATYDQFGRPLTTTAPDGVVTTNTYEAATSVAGASGTVPAMKVTTTVKHGTTTVAPTQVVHFDVLGRKIASEVDAVSASEVMRQRTAYDTRGRVQYETKPTNSTATGGLDCTGNADANCTWFAYDDDNGRVVRVDRADGGQTDTAYACDGPRSARW